jgi:hypothetical protein
MELVHKVCPNILVTPCIASNDWTISERRIGEDVHLFSVVYFTTLPGYQET